MNVVFLRNRTKLLIYVWYKMKRFSTSKCIVKSSTFLFLPFYLKKSMKIETKLHKGGHPPQFRGENTFFSFQKNHKLDSNFSKLARFTHKSLLMLIFTIVQILWFWVDTKIIKNAEIYFSSWSNFISAFFTN